ncbi:pyridoxine/pyridoxamine 5'-phosphate oxidase isoform X2 [Vespa crabro]|uniref:pyridoxine/pyridoxamine 5'-phosphate oxidase isoform X2 n=1 Tax=Vespa crabro TaxID=7445 RepID=UPI001F01A6DE|nr:pyridoxine/pyridoxamine 5'-phosphate oxidase isoform X2 [Vespa crabro]
MCKMVGDYKQLIFKQFVVNSSVVCLSRTDSKPPVLLLYIVKQTKYIDINNFVWYNKHAYRFTKEPKISEEYSDLAKINDLVDDPMDLFKSWHEESRKYLQNMLDIFCLATSSIDNKIAARNVVLREFDNEGFVLVTDQRSRKASELDSVPRAAACFVWCYIDDKGQNIVRQVRAEGTVKKLEPKEFKHLYDREPLFCKIRSHLCHQGHAIDWDDLKRRHDEIVKEYQSGKNTLPMPEHFIGYKLIPTMIEFYYAKDNLIGDRMQYNKNTSIDGWQQRRLAA